MRSAIKQALKERLLSKRRRSLGWTGMFTLLVTNQQGAFIESPLLDRKILNSRDQLRDDTPPELRKLFVATRVIVCQFVVIEA